MNTVADIGVLSGKERTALRARAHSLKPVVWVADSGITPGAMHEIDRALNAHELIKVHAAVSGREARTALLADICTALGAQPVQVIGKMLVVFRHRPEHETPPQQSKSAAKPAKRSKGTSKKTRSKRMPIRANRPR
jgi:RNA-binding protein